MLTKLPVVRMVTLAGPVTATPTATQMAEATVRPLTDTLAVDRMGVAALAEELEATRCPI